MGYPRYQAIRTEEGSDLEGVFPSEVDLRLVQVYGSYNHQNDSFHMDGGIQNENV